MSEVATLETVLNRMKENIKQSIIGCLPFKVGDIVKVDSPVKSNRYRKINAYVRDIKVYPDFATGDTEVKVVFTPRYLIYGKEYVPSTEYITDICDIYPAYETTRTMYLAKAE